jgi:site-specific recombinase XerD
MKLHDAARDYLAYLRHEQGATATTIRTYKSGLNSFLRWMQENGHPDPSTFDFNAATLRRYLYVHSEKGLRPRTLRGRFHPLRALAKFLIAHNALKTDPTKSVILPKKDPAIRLTVSEEEVHALLAACERLPDLNRVSLYRAVLSALIFAGLRRQELLDLCLTDFDPKESSLIVRHGKGNKERIVYLPDVAVEALLEWVAVRPASALDYLFLWDRSKRVSQDALAAIVEESKAIAGYRNAPNIKPHSLRHFYASHLLHNGADLESTRQLLGHADLRTTSIYIHADRQRVRDVARLAALTPTKPQEPGNVIRLPQHEAERPRLRRIAR